MKAHQIQVGKRYAVKVSGKVVPCRVDAIMEQTSWKGRSCKTYRCTNTVTGREITVKSPLKFRFSVEEMERAGISAFTVTPD